MVSSLLFYEHSATLVLPAISNLLSRFQVSTRDRLMGMTPFSSRGRWLLAALLLCVIPKLIYALCSLSFTVLRGLRTRIERLFCEWLLPMVYRNHDLMSSSR